MGPRNRRDEGAALPQLFPKTLALYLTLVVAAGCTTSDLGVDEMSLSLADPDLPETVSVLPSFSGEPVVAALASGGDAAAAIMPAAFAGPTPNDPAAGFAPSGIKVAARSPELDQLIARYAVVHGIPEEDRKSVG